MDTTDKVLTYILVGMVGVLGGLLVSTCVDNTIPNTVKIQQGFIAPSRLKVKYEDQDRNGELETILQIDDKKYMLRDVNGVPTLSAYEVKPAEILYK